MVPLFEMVVDPEPPVAVTETVLPEVDNVAPDDTESVSEGLRLTAVELLLLTTLSIARAWSGTAANRTAKTGTVNVALIDEREDIWNFMINLRSNAKGTFPI